MKSSKASAAGQAKCLVDLRRTSSAVDTEQLTSSRLLRNRIPDTQRRLTRHAPESPPAL